MWCPKMDFRKHEMSIQMNLPYQIWEYFITVLVRITYIMVNNKLIPNPSVLIQQKFISYS